MMKKMMEKLMSESDNMRKEKDMPESKQMSKADIKAMLLEALREEMDNMMSMDKMHEDMPHEMKKVSVMAKDTSDLEKGLDKAKELLSEESSEDEEMPEEHKMDKNEDEEEDY